MKVFHLREQLCIDRDKEGMQHGGTGFKGQNRGHELELYAMYKVQGALHGAGASRHLEIQHSGLRTIFGKLFQGLEHLRVWNRNLGGCLGDRKGKEGRKAKGENPLEALSQLLKSQLNTPMNIFGSMLYVT